MLPRVFYTDHHSIPLPDGHKFPITKYRLLRERLEREQLFRFDPAPLARREVIELAHDPDYVSQFLNGSLDPKAMRRIGFPWSEGLVNRTLASVGGTLSASQDALDTGWGGTLAGGTHHAFRAEGSGFCVFNDIAIAILWLRQKWRIARVAVIDLDVHQGDGTAQIFSGDDSVLTVSLHGAHNFPFRKQQSKIDRELPDRCLDTEYDQILEETLPRVARFAPEIIFFQSGVDGLATDALGRLSLTQAGLHTRDLRILRLAREIKTPLVITLGGGYSKPIEHTVEAHAQTYIAAAKFFHEPITSVISPQ